ITATCSVHPSVRLASWFVDRRSASPVGWARHRLALISSASDFTVSYLASDPGLAALVRRNEHEGPLPLCRRSSAPRGWGRIEPKPCHMGLRSHCRMLLPNQPAPGDSL